MTEPSLTLIIETAEGTAIRRIPNATVLSDAETQGYAAEDATRSAAATWGMPDFVFRPQQQRTGSRVREIGDGLLLVGTHAAVVQVKSRTDPSNNPDRERSWLTKNVAKGLSQGSGTVRDITRSATPLTNARGRTILVDGADFDWLTVVVIDHPRPPTGVVPPAAPTAVPAVVLLRRDWEFLFDHLRSTRAVLSYLERVAHSGDLAELGTEPSRYHQYALADLAASADTMDPRLTAMIESAPSTLISSTRAPLDSAWHDEGPAHRLLRMIMEDVANLPMAPEAEANRLTILAELDGLPVSARTELGQTLMRFMSSATVHRGETTLIHNRTVVPNPGDFAPLLFVVASDQSTTAKEILTFKSQILHHDYNVALDRPDGLTIALMLTPTTVEGRLWDTTLQALWGDQGQPPEFIEELRTFVTDGHV